MNKRVVILLLSSAAFSFAAFAQSTSTSSSQTGPTATYSASDADSVREPLTWPKAQNWWDGDDPNFVNLVLHPFARKAWVKRQIAPIRDRINELDEITAENATKIKDIDARSRQGLQLASEKANLADQHASDAATRAQSAQAAATQVSTSVANTEQVASNLDQYKGEAQTEIRFRPGQTVLSKQAKDALDQMVAPVKNQHSYIIEVRGFYPGRGHAAIATSQKMADSVVRYLVETHQIPIYRIYVLGMGDATPAAEAGTKHNPHPRVEVNLLKNDLVSTARR
jgi:outer membrane protein OmpA-like peptidoglycan-associated protein